MSDGKNIAILIPTTSRGSNYETVEDTDLFSQTLHTFLLTKCPQHTYKFFIGIDSDDAFYMNPTIQEQFRTHFREFFEIQFYTVPPCKGNVVSVWNELFKIAIKSKTPKFHYFHQVGSDIHYLDKGWVSKSIEELESLKDIGVVGHTDWGRKQYDSEDSLLTQTFVSRKHFLIFGYYFHPYIKNWYCDNWITDIYKGANRYCQIPHRIQNMGGEPRYKIDNCGSLCKMLIENDSYKIPYYIDLRKRIILN
jgi:hypothetical protein